MFDLMTVAETESEKRKEAKLRRDLGIIVREFEHPDTEDLVLNPDGKLWAKRAGTPEWIYLGSFPARAALSAFNSIADYRGEVINRDNPILGTTIPFLGCRFEGLLPPIVDAPSFAIRKGGGRLRPLDEYVADGVLSTSHREVIRSALRERKNILVIGGTGTGKTSLANAILLDMSVETPNDRVVIIEDNAELRCSVPNSISLLARGKVTMVDCLKSSMRLNPTRMIVGEVRGPESLALLNAWNTGHPGGISTLHADNARMGLSRLESLLEEATTAPKQKFIAEAVNLVVYIGRDPTVKAGRRVKEIYAPSGYDGRDYQGTYL